METLLYALLVFLGPLVVVLGGISLVAALRGQPDEAETAFLTSGFPGERLIRVQVCNACITDAEIDDMAGLVLKALGAAEAAALSFEAIRSLTGGLWVGGRVGLTSHRVMFLPNAMNRAVHRDVEIIALRLEDVVAVRDRFGVLTRIVDFETAAGTLTVRVYKARRFLRAVEAAREAR